MSDWQDALAPTPECIDVARLGEELDVARLGEELDAAQRAHLETCVRCQSELALYREITRAETSPEEAEAARWIAGELQRRNNVVPFRAKTWRVLYAVAAALVLVIGAGWWLQLREPSVDAPVDGPGTYRSGRLELIAPIGDLAQAPNELRWRSVPDATLYRARILEVDRSVVWSGETAQTRVALPAAVIAQFAPGKSLLWEVQAFRGTDMLASSETQTVRVTP